MKTCKRCSEEKDESEFYKDRTRPSGLHDWCKSCKKNHQKESYHSSPSIKTRRLRELQVLQRVLGERGLKLCSTCNQAKPFNDYYKGEHRCKICCVKRASDYTRRTRRGWTPEAYDAQYALQKGKCAICGKPEEKKALAGDHNHKTNATRGLLCNNCNNGLGRFKDDVSILLSAAAYLMQYSNDNGDAILPEGTKRFEVP